MANDGADIIAIDVAGKLPPCVPCDPATPDDLAEIVNLVEAAGQKILASVVDIRDVDGLREAVDGGVKRWVGSTSSSPTPVSPLPRSGMPSLPKTFATSSTSTSPAHGTPSWRERRRSRWRPRRIHRSDQLRSGHQDATVHGHYTASKHAVTGMARAFAAELGKHSILVNSVQPGAVNTPVGSGDMISALGRAIETYPQLAQIITPFLPTWAAEPEDIADAVCWLTSDESKNVTAAAISIDQGVTQY
jgi:NAD(P)-dependent dehydrogenase (short-subunit alcohol dehydrogenase family)